MDILITNNPLAKERFEGKFNIAFVDGPLLDVLIAVRNRVHNGHTLLTHPLSGSVKPNETLYKSVLISRVQGAVDERSVSVIGECILATQKFAPRAIPERAFADLQEVDLALISGALQL
ncbi:MAG: GrdX family protein [Oscillospiraceae bacterium]|nr:GrdX family protein [Oscillospiraceae bacterium]